MPQFNPEWLGIGHGLIMGFEKRVCPRGQRQAAAMALRAACSEMKIRRTHTTSPYSTAAIERAMSDRCGPGQALERAIIELEGLLSRRAS